MNKTDLKLYAVLESEIKRYSQKTKKIEILNDSKIRTTFILQLIDSIRRIKFVTTISKTRIGKKRALPSSETFDPVRAAIYHLNKNNEDEASWLIFLSTHFGYSPSSRWLLTKDIYGKLGHTPFWDWQNVSQNVEEFKNWATTLPSEIEKLSPKRKFGNHHKFESIRPDAPRPLHKVFSTYIDMITPYGSHQNLFTEFFKQNNSCKYETFDFLYKYFKPVLSFGRTSRFDYLCMLGKLGVVNIEPPKTYMSGSTGPRDGAKLLFGNKDSTPKQLEDELFELCNVISADPFGMQVLEDALCN